LSEVDSSGGPAVDAAPLPDWYPSLAEEGTNYRRYIDAAESTGCTDYTDKMPCDSRVLSIYGRKRKKRWRIAKPLG
jgi:hypothetical protein